MNVSPLAVLNDAERLLIAENDRARLAVLDEDAAIEFGTRIRRARNKYIGQYRRVARAAVIEHHRDGKGSPGEYAGPHKGRGVRRDPVSDEPPSSDLAQQPAVKLRTERLAAARAVKHGRRPDTGRAVSTVSRTGAAVTGEPPATGRGVHLRPSGGRAPAHRAPGPRRRGTGDEYRPGYMPADCFRRPVGRGVESERRGSVTGDD